MTILISNHQNCFSLNQTRIRKAARRILSLLKQSGAELSILFVDNEDMQRLNNAFRGKNRPTDVLSFDSGVPAKNNSSRRLSGFRPYVLGDIVVNTQMVLSRALESGTDIYDEIYRILIHGSLHLLGYDHKKRYDAVKMEKKEEEIFNALKKAC